MLLSDVLSVLLFLLVLLRKVFTFFVFFFDDHHSSKLVFKFESGFVGHAFSVLLLVGSDSVLDLFVTVFCFELLKAVVFCELL